jgi:F-type H+-transporting ATPase subunit beta
VVARARRLERFLTQPFFTTEQFTGLRGKLVSLKDALDGCERILGDEFKEYPESALYMTGAVDEAKEKAKSGKSAGNDSSQPGSKTEAMGNPKPAPDSTPKAGSASTPKLEPKSKPEAERADNRHES